MRVLPGSSSPDNCLTLFCECLSKSVASAIPFGLPAKAKASVWIDVVIFALAGSAAAAVCSSLLCSYLASFIDCRSRNRACLSSLLKLDFEDEKSTIIPTCFTATTIADSASRIWLMTIMNHAPSTICPTGYPEKESDFRRWHCVHSFLLLLPQPLRRPSQPASRNGFSLITTYTT